MICIDQSQPGVWTHIWSLSQWWTQSVELPAPFLPLFILKRKIDLTSDGWAKYKLNRQQNFERQISEKIRLFYPHNKRLGILFAVPDACKWTRGGWEILMKAGRWLPGQLWRCQVSDLVWGAASHWSAGSLMRPLIGPWSRILLQPVQDPDKSWVMITSQPETGTEENKTKYIRFYHSDVGTTIKAKGELGVSGKSPKRYYM